jgi:hypothetical protein
MFRASHRLGEPFFVSSPGCGNTATGFKAVIRKNAETDSQNI